MIFTERRGDEEERIDLSYASASDDEGGFFMCQQEETVMNIWRIFLLSTFVVLGFMSCTNGDKSNDDDAANTPDETVDDDTSDLDDDTTSDDDTLEQKVWTDPVTGLRWQVDPTNQTMDWFAAYRYCANLPKDGSWSWRVPTISELRSLIRGCEETETHGSCGVTDSCLFSDCRNSYCDGCSFDGGPTSGCYWPTLLHGKCSWYWSSSDLDDLPGAYAWNVDFDYGLVYNNIVYYEFSVRCVN